MNLRFVASNENNPHLYKGSLIIGHIDGKKFETINFSGKATECRGH